MKFSELVQKLNLATDRTSLSVNPDGDPDIQGIAPIDQVTKDTISYIEGAKFAARVKTTEASALILPPDEELQRQATERGIAWIGASEPRLLFARAIALFYQPWKPVPEIHASAVIHPEAQVGEGVYIGAHVVIQAGVRIGDGVCIHPNVVIYPNVQIGDRTILHGNCTIHERSQIGADCVIHSGVVIGAEGFGFVPTKEGWLKMEQSGYTVLEDGVEVGCNTTIDRPAVGETRIGRQTKIDNLVQIGHGCQVGGACAIRGASWLGWGCECGESGDPRGASRDCQSR
jgi:UDP-3-O-[3-hydroxymyristoyl] glucosamine N-acyltransferase